MVQHGHHGSKPRLLERVYLRVDTDPYIVEITFVKLPLVQETFVYIDHQVLEVYKEVLSIDSLHVDHHPLEVQVTFLYITVYGTMTASIYKVHFAFSHSFVNYFNLTLNILRSVFEYFWEHNCDVSLHRKKR